MSSKSGSLDLNQFFGRIAYTYGYELLGAAALAVVVIHPRQVRRFEKAAGQLAKTDRVDADVRALFVERAERATRQEAPRSEPSTE